MRRFLLALTIISAILLTGVACSSARPQATANKSQTATSTAPIVIKKQTADNKNVVYDFCESAKNEIIIRFDQETQTSKAFCRFYDTTECAAEEYYQNKCGPGKGSKIYLPNKPTVTSAEVCAQEYQPVCGENNITFTNECVAKMQGIKIIKNSACPPAETAITNDSANSPTEEKEHGNPDWLALVQNFILAQPVQSPRTHIDSCHYFGSAVYLQSGSYSILYDSNGKIICYPDNDFSNVCADFSHSADNCSRIWTDIR